MKFKYLVLFVLILSVFSYNCHEDCEPGFSGEDCEIRVSDKFLGTYEGYQNCGPENEFISLEISRDKGARDVFIDFRPDFKLKGTVFGDTLTIPDQRLAIPQFMDTTYILIFDSYGILSNDTLNLDIIFYPVSSQVKIYCNYSMVRGQ